MSDTHHSEQHSREEFLRRSGVAVATVAAFGSLGAAPALARRATTPKRVQVVNFRLDWIRTGYQSPFYLTLDKGFWRKRGLEVNILEGSGSADAVKAVISGRTHFGFADSSTMALSAAQGAPVFAVAGIVNKSPLCFFSLKSKNIQTPQDLIGKTVLTTLGGSDGAMLPGFLAVNNLSPEQVTVQGVAPAAKVSLLLVGKADAATGVLYSQVPIIEAQGIPLNVMLWADHGMNLISNGFVATKALAKKNPELMRNFVGGLVAGITYAKTHEKEAVNAYMNHFPQENRAVVTEATRLFLSVLDSANTKGHPAGYQSPKDWEASLKILTAAGLMKTPGRADQYFTNAFLPKRQK